MKQFLPSMFALFIFVASFSYASSERTVHGTGQEKARISAYQSAYIEALLKCKRLGGELLPDTTDDRCTHHWIDGWTCDISVICLTNE
jgi:hypothetical protein